MAPTSGLCGAGEKGGEAAAAPSGVLRGLALRRAGQVGQGRGLGGFVGERKEAGRRVGRKGNADKPPCSLQPVKRFPTSSLCDLAAQ